MRNFTHFLLYSNIWIGVCAAALVTYTYDITGSGIGLDAYAGAVFCGTVVLYTLHRLVGMRIVGEIPEQGRFVVIRRYRIHMLVTGGAGLAGMIYFLFQLPAGLLWWLGVPGIIGFLYVMPLYGGKRLRDYALVKIFLLSGVWAALTGLIPFVHTGLMDWTSGTLLFFERALFIFAIAIPFDIRDWHVDKYNGLRTLPHVVGIRSAKLLALVILGVSGVLTLILISMGIYDHRLVIPYFMCWVITTGLIWYSKTDLDDHYYSGLLDGMMFLLAFGYWLVTM